MILKNIQRLSTERVLPDPAGLFVHLCVSTCKRYYQLKNPFNGAD